MATGIDEIALHATRSILGVDRTLPLVRREAQIQCIVVDALHAIRKEYGTRHVGINKLRDEMAAAYRHAEVARTNLSRARLLAFIDAINLLC